jgi:RimK family alpha-L-glutamate ligase
VKSVWILHYNAKDNYECDNLIEAYRRAGIRAEARRPKDFTISANKSMEKSMLYLNERVELPELVLSRTGSGSNYFTLALMRQFENLRVPVINSSDSILKVKDKLWTSQLLTSAGIPTPKTMLVSFPVNADVVEREIGYPCVVKLVSGSGGNGVYLCENKKFFNELMELIESLKPKKTLIIQEYIDFGQGSDLRVWVIDGKTVAAMKRTAPEGDFRANITNGGSGEHFEITPEIDQIAKKTAKLMGLEIAGIDLLFDKKKFKVCEANSSPGFEGMDKFCHRNMARKIADYTQKKYL